MTKRVKLNEIDTTFLNDIEPGYDEFELESICSFKIPTKLIDFSNELEEIDGLKKYTNQDVIKYLTDIMKGGVDICFINGISHGTPCCDFCDNCGISDDDQVEHYCYDCHKDICGDCFVKDICKEHDRQPRSFPIGFICDLCEKDIEIAENRYSDREDNVDCCMDCYKEQKDNLLPLTFVDGTIFAETFTRFGSIFDWVPLYSYKDQHNYEDMILMCVNPDNQHYKKLALSTIDNDGRRGWYTCPEKDTIESLLKEFSEKIKGLDDEMNNAPIQQMMLERNMVIYYG